ncbi:MAG: cupin domain-containing protein [Candidatus Eisenbacteria bacterium]
MIERLGLAPLPVEGGWFRETWRSSDVWPRAALPSRYPGERCAATAILYLLTADTCSLMHRLRSPELYCFHDGDPVEMLCLDPGGEGSVLRFGHDHVAGERVQVLVSAGTWQGSRLVTGGAWALFSVVVAPGYEPADFEHATRATARRLARARGDDPRPHPRLSVAAAHSRQRERRRFATRHHLG